MSVKTVGSPALKGVATPLTLYRVVKEGEAQSRFQVVVRKGLTPLVGREHEFGLLRERWEQVKDGRRASRAAQRGAGHWQIAAGGGAQGDGRARGSNAVWSCAVRRITRTVRSIR